MRVLTKTSAPDLDPAAALIDNHRCMPVRVAQLARRKPATHTCPQRGAVQLDPRRAG